MTLFKSSSMSHRHLARLSSPRCLSLELMSDFSGWLSVFSWQLYVLELRTRGRAFDNQQTLLACRFGHVVWRIARRARHWNNEMVWNRFKIDRKSSTHPIYLTALRSIGFLNSSSHTNRLLQTSESTPRNLKNKSVKIVCVSSLICRPPS